MRALMVALCLAFPATAQTVFDRAAGLYGSTTDPEQSCSTNPHQLSFLANPPHVILTWVKPRLDLDGFLTTEDTYDLRDVTAFSLTLRREADGPLLQTGLPPVWILRLTVDGYCMGRQDWPLVRCINPAIRCDNTQPNS